VAAAAAPTPPVRSEAPASRPDPRKPVKRPDNKRLERKTGRDADEPEAAAPRKRAGRSIQDVRAEAAIPYRAKNFAAAAAAVNAALPSFTGAEVQELKGLAANYSQFGKSYNVGTAPGTKATEAFALLTKARSIDRDFLGGIYVPEIEQKLIGIGTRAAATFMVSKNYEEAFQAVHTSESLGGKSSTNKSVRDSLDEAAADLLREASAALASDPGTARAKARQAQALVEPKTPLYLRAAKLINGS
jgi:hypothetical protein